MAITETFHVDPRWLPTKMHNLVWTKLEDVTLIEKDTVIFDPDGPYAGRIHKMPEANGKQFVMIRWYKGIDNTVWENIPLARLVEMYLWWADPCMQPED